jgi:hypothetical protein
MSRGRRGWTLVPRCRQKGQAEVRQDQSRHPSHQGSPLLSLLRQLPIGSYPLDWDICGIRPAGKCGNKAINLSENIPERRRRLWFALPEVLDV